MSVLHQSILISSLLCFAGNAFAQQSPASQDYPPAQPVPAQQPYPPAQPAPAQQYPQPVYQQPQYQPPRGIHRQGFVFGFSIGGGIMAMDNCEDCDSLSGAAGEIHLGGMVTPQLAILGEAFGISHEVNNSFSLYQYVYTVAAQYWLGPKFWLRLGLGSGLLAVSSSDGDLVAESESGAAVMLGAGFEILQGNSFTLDLQLRAGAVSYDENATVSISALSLGFNWY